MNNLYFTLLDPERKWNIVLVFNGVCSIFLFFVSEDTFFSRKNDKLINFGVVYIEIGSSL